MDALGHEMGYKETYTYDKKGQVLGKLDKEGCLTRYGYDAFGNRTWKEESGERTSYQYNILNQMVSEKHGELLKAYRYDKRGNLTGILENGVWKKQYVYGAINRLEEAVDTAGNSRQITDTLDLAKQYYKFVEQTEENRSQRYFWDGNMVAYEENGERNYYLLYELGNSLRIENSAGNFKASYGYGFFGKTSIRT